MIDLHRSYLAQLVLFPGFAHRCYGVIRTYKHWMIPSPTLVCVDLPMSLEGSVMFWIPLSRTGRARLPNYKN